MATPPHETASPATRAAILRTWDAGTDTAAIADMFDMDEAEVERILVEEREERRAGSTSDEGQNL